LRHIKAGTAGGVVNQPPARAQRSTSMLDVIMLAIGLAFFAVSIGYAYACDRL
jgi:hypothetical protein